MNNLLFGISLSALLSTTSLLIVLFRVSPLTAPAQAVPAFFVSLFLTIGSLGALGFLAFWHYTHLVSWDMGKAISISLRQGIFLGCATTLLLGFHLLGLLTWWVSVMIYSVFLLIELALDH